MQVRRRALQRLSALAAALVLAACGGGSDTGTASTAASPGATETAQALFGHRSHPHFRSNLPPFVAVRIRGEAVMQAATVFNTAGTTDIDGSIVSRSWSYGDGQTGTEDTHVYQQPGHYLATLSVTDDKGATGRAALWVKVAKCSKAGTGAAALAAGPTVCMQTSKGEMVVELFPTQAPVTAANFLRYVDEGFYAGTLFHRVIPGFVIQGGGFTSGLKYRMPTHDPIVLESNNGLKNLTYTLSMARTGIPNSATSQFFVNLVDNHGLDYNATVKDPNGYAVFGRVIHGTSVVEQIATVPTTAVLIPNVTTLYNVPITEVVIRSAMRLP